MLRPPRPSRTPAVGPVLLAAASVLLLAGCSGAMPGATDPAAPPTASEAPVPAPSASQPAEPEEKPVPFEVACDELLSADDIYAFNPNYGTDPGFEPSADAVVGVVDEAGTACGLLNQTNGAVIEFGVATPPARALEARMGDAALHSNVVPTYGTPPDVEGYFTRAGDVGEAQVFTGPYWVVIDSTELFEPGDAQRLVSALLANLPAG